MRFALSLVLVLTSSVAACATSSGRRDGGVRRDTGTEADASGVDAGLPADDAFVVGMDAFADLDAGPALDAGRDAAPSIDAGPDAAMLVDAGHDAGSDGGSDAGRDAGSDGGSDAGRDAGPASATRFDFTGSLATYVVPTGVTSVRIVAERERTDGGHVFRRSRGARRRRRHRHAR